VNVHTEARWPLHRLASLRKLYLNTKSHTLPKTLWQLPHLLTLELFSISNVNSLSDEIPATAKPKSLKIHHSDLTSLPDTIGRLSDLTSLIVICAKLQQLPDQLAQLSSLRVLELKHCMAGPLILRHELTALERIDISGPCYDDVDIGALVKPASLRSLSISNAKITTGSLEFAAHNRLTSLKFLGPVDLPASMQNLSQLTELTLENVCSLERLPDKIGRLTALTALTIESCCHGSTEAMTSLTNLRRVHMIVAANLPASVATLSNLEELRIRLVHSYEDVNISADIGHLTNLTLLELDVKGTETGYPALLSLPRLQEAIFWVNDGAESNQVNSMLANATQIRTLEVVSCSEQQPPLPPVIATLFNLRELRLNYSCRRVRLPEIITSLSKLTSLSIHLDAGALPLYNLDVVFDLTTLRRLDIDGDGPERLPEQVTRLQQLRVFGLPYCMQLCGQVTRLRRLMRIGNMVSVGDEEHTQAAAELARRGVTLTWER
jgi:hypothetical protein